MEGAFISLQSNPLSLQRSPIRLSKIRTKQSSEASKGTAINLAVTFFRSSTS